MNQEGIEAAWVQGDVRRPEDARLAVQKAIDLYGSLDILVNSAAGNFLVAAEDLSVKGFKTVMEIDAVGVFNMSRAAFKFLKRRESAAGADAQDTTTSVIINISATLHYGATWFQVRGGGSSDVSCLLNLLFSTVLAKAGPCLRRQSRNRQLNKIPGHGMGRIWDQSGGDCAR